MRIALCDDNYVQLQILEKAAHGCVHWSNEKLVVDTFSDGDELLKSVNSGAKYEYIFLDIEMPGKSGFDVYKELGFRPDTAIVFVSTHYELLPEAFELQPRGFLVKPYDQDTYDRAVKSVMAQRARVKHFVYTANGADNALPCNKIYYFEKDKHCLHVHTTAERASKLTLLRITLDAVEQQLSDFGFFRCNRSFLVNLQHCVARKGAEVIFKSNCELKPIKLAESKFREFDRTLMKYKTGEGDLF